MLIVGLTGTHGTGKSTIIHGAENAGHSVSRAQLSRAAQKALGWDTLARAQENTDNMWALQDAILAAMDARDAAIAAPTLVERTPADMWAYTKMWCERLDIDVNTDLRALQYKGECLRLSERYAEFVFVPMMQQIPFVEEPNRADLASRAPVEISIKNFIIQNELPFYAIRGITPRDRAFEITLVLEKVETRWL